jgi:membrane protein
VLGASLGTTSYFLSVSRGLVSGLPNVLAWILNALEFVLLAAAYTALYRYVPNTPVKRAHALAGGVFAAIGIEVAKRGLAWYIGIVPTYSMVYGAFATVPILLVWIYICWVIVLLGAVIAAYLPSILAGPRRLGGGHGWQFQLALETLGHLDQVRPTARRGLTTSELAAPLTSWAVEPVLETRSSWTGRPPQRIEDRWHALRAAGGHPGHGAGALMRLLLPQSDATAKLWQTGGLSAVYLADVI